MPSAIRFSRQPYTVKYFDRYGDLQEIKRRPPKKLHDILPTDQVELKHAKNDDWPKDDYTVKHINPKHPNVIQIQNGDGNATFVSALDLVLEEKVGVRENGINPRDEPINNEYLSWP